jgi:hypothetical protein
MFQVQALSKFGLKVFMDAHQPVTLKEGDRYPLGPPKNFCSNQSGDNLCCCTHCIDRRKSTV